jgi:hypothetical protein
LYMRLNVRVMFVFATVLGCFACGNSAPPAASAAPAASASAAPAASVAAGEFGVAECDDYMKKYLACVDKLAPAAQSAARQGLEQSRAAWKQAAATEQGRAALATTCKAASDAAATAMRAQGCTW